MPSHWKDWLDFTHSERNGFLLLFLLIVLGLVTPYVIPYFFPPEKNDFSKIKMVLKELEAQRKLDSLAQIEEKRASKNVISEASEIEPFAFNPNTASFEDFQKLGLSKKVAHIVINYREKGGKFYEKDDFKKIYGISEEKFEELRPFITLPLAEKSNAEEQKSTKSEKPFEKKSETKVEKLQPEGIAINTADSLELQKIKGIGPAFASMIIKYRDLLGGYLNKSQVLEVYGMDSARWENTIPYLSIDSNNIQKININTAAWADLVRHPYIDKHVANQIVNHRKYNGSYTAVSDLKNKYLVKKRLYRKIAAYLTINDRAEAKKGN